MFQSPILQETPDTKEDFDRLLPLHLELKRNQINSLSVQNLTTSVASGSFFGPDGNSPTNLVTGFNYNGANYTKDVIVPYSSGAPNNYHVFYVNGTITWDPSIVIPIATNVQYLGIQINPTEFLLDIKEPYVRLL